MISSILLATALLGQAPDVCECETYTPVSQTLAFTDPVVFEESVSVDPVYVLRYHHGIRRGACRDGWFAHRRRFYPFYPAFTKVRYHYYLW